MDATPRYFDELASVLRAVQVTRGDGVAMTLGQGLDEVVTLITACGAAERKVIFIGNGGSAAIASHQAVDCWKNGGIRALAFNDSSLLTCVGNDFGYPHIFEKPVEMFVDPGDVLIAISSSGKSENILRGSKAGLTKGCSLITMSGFTPDNSLRSMGSVNFYAPSSLYSYVEITHLALCHCVVDAIIERRV